jgi:hypothetical protein
MILFVTGDMVRGVAQRFTHAQIQRVARGGHWPHVEQQPARVAALLADYLKTLSPALFSRLRFIGIRSVATLTVEQTWDGLASMKPWMNSSA